MLSRLVSSRRFFSSAYTVTQVKCESKESTPTGMYYDRYLCRLVTPESHHAPVSASTKPMSPWIIYNWGMTNAMSMTHRITGIALTGTFYLSALAYLAFPGTGAFLGAVYGLPFAVKALFKMSVCFPLAYHSINGVRHLGWDCGSNLDLPSLYQTGRQTIAAAGLIGLLAYAMYL